MQYRRNIALWLSEAGLWRTAWCLKMVNLSLDESAAVLGCANLTGPSMLLSLAKYLQIYTNGSHTIVDTHVQHRKPPSTTQDGETYVSISAPESVLLPL